jgi:hypothetical protein
LRSPARFRAAIRAVAPRRWTALVPLLVRYPTEEGRLIDEDPSTDPNNRARLGQPIAGNALAARIEAIFRVQDQIS